MDIPTIAKVAVENKQAVQKIPELERLLWYMDNYDPRFIVEIGSYRGGTLWAFKQAFPKAEVIGIDTGRDMTGRDYYQLHAEHRVARENSERVRDYLWNDHGIADFVFIDGDHSYEGVKRDYQIWGEAINVAFHDIIPHSDVEVPKFWEEIRRPTSREFKNEPMTWGGIGIL